MQYKAAMLEKKQNTFDDFIAAAEWLIENKYTSTERLSIRGGSNGGLLVGAFMNQRPDLCKAVICTYPLLDMVRFHKFLMGPYWVGEYGSADGPVTITRWKSNASADRISAPRFPGSDTPSQMTTCLWAGRENSSSSVSEYSKTPRTP